MQSQRIDPLVLSAWTHDIATWLPSLTRQEHSRYVQLQWPTRLRWLKAFAIWGTTHRISRCSMPSGKPMWR